MASATFDKEGNIALRHRKTNDEAQSSLLIIQTQKQKETASDDAVSFVVTPVRLELTTQ